MPITPVPEATNHAALIAALAVIRMEIISRQEEVHLMAARNQKLNARVTRMSEELTGLNVDATTVGNVNTVAESLDGQTGAALSYAAQTDTTATQAEQASRVAIRNHGAIEEAANNAPMRMANPPFYGEGE